jgi:PIN domain nuclease of toxin-antitoxin system
MNSFVTDTMAYILHLEKRKMPKKSKAIFDDTENGKSQIIVPSMTVAEIAYLSEKKRIDTDLNEVQEHLQNSKNFKEQPLTNDIVRVSFEIDDVPELHDKLIAGTAKHLNCPIITNDPKIETSKHVKSILKK